MSLFAFISATSAVLSGHKWKCTSCSVVLCVPATWGSTSKSLRTINFCFQSPGTGPGLVTSRPVPNRVFTEFHFLHCTNLHNTNSTFLAVSGVQYPAMKPAHKHCIHTTMPSLRALHFTELKTQYPSSQFPAAGTRVFGNVCPGELRGADRLPA